MSVPDQLLIGTTAPEKMVAKLQPDETSKCSPVKTHGACKTKPRDLLIEELVLQRSTQNCHSVDQQNKKTH
jgi:hypothetical protein